MSARNENTFCPPAVGSAWRRFVLLLALSLLPAAAVQAQTTYSPNDFSPYTMFGLGDPVTPATASMQAMGSVGVAMRPNTAVGMQGANIEINYLNPASNAFIPQRSALFSIGGVWRSYIGKGNGYDYQGNYVSATGSRNSFSLNDIGLAFPLCRFMGMSLSLTPSTFVGYRVTSVGTEQEVVTDVGRMLYTYSGEGGMSEAKASVGARPFKNLGIGASFGYYFGNLYRTYQANVLEELRTQTDYRYIDGIENTHISDIFYELGFIYTVRVSKNGYLNFGGTFRTVSVMDPLLSKEQYVTNGNSVTDTLTVSGSRSRMKVPARFAGGVYYADPRFSAGIDYEYQDYRNAFQTDAPLTGYTLEAVHQIRAGVSFTPDRNDLYEGMRRWTYKLGVKCGTTYLVKDGYRPKSASVTLGVDIPMKRGTINKASVALEGGMRGKEAKGQVKEYFIKVSAGFAFFGDDMWFQRRKFY